MTANRRIGSLRRRSFLLSASGLMALVSGACATKYSVEPRTVTHRGSPILTALRYGVTAPSPHNTQPWLFDIRSETEARLYFDRDRRLVFTDPPIRQGHLGHGTLLETIRLAAPLFGHRAEIDLLPDGPMTPETYGERPTAAIRVQAAPSSEVDPLSAVMGTRQTSRGLHEGPAISASDAETLLSEVHPPEGATIEVVRDERVAALREVAKKAMAIEVNDRELYDETLTWFRFTPEELRESPDGLTLKTADADTAAARAFLRPRNWHSKMNRRVYLKRFDAAVDSTTAFVAVSSQDNTMRDWIISGQAWLRTQLAAHRHGLWMHPLSQILQEFPQMDPLRPRFDELLPRSSPGRVQMLARITRGPTPAKSPRRDVDAMRRSS